MPPQKFPIYLVEFPSQYLTNATLLRFEEHYESPKFHGKIFTWEEYMDWYAEENDNFTYFSDWSGFNIPSWALLPFREGKFNPLTKKEAALLEMFQKVDGDFYIIGAKKGNSGTILHEMAHGLFYAYPNYRKDVEKYLSSLNLKKMIKHLVREGYSERVAVDELNAYLLTGFDILKGSEPKAKLKKIHNQLQEIFQRHFGVYLKKKKRRYFEARIHKMKFVYEE
jgi:hypothetical protein